MATPNPKKYPAAIEIDRIIDQTPGRGVALAQMIGVRQATVSLSRQTAIHNGSTSKLFALLVDYLGLGCAETLCPELKGIREKNENQLPISGN